MTNDNEEKRCCDGLTTDEEMAKLLSRQVASTLKGLKLLPGGLALPVDGATAYGWVAKIAALEARLAIIPVLVQALEKEHNHHHPDHIYKARKTCPVCTALHDQRED